MPTPEMPQPPDNKPDKDSVSQPKKPGNDPDQTPEKETNSPPKAKPGTEPYKKTKIGYKK